MYVLTIFTQNWLIGIHIFDDNRGIDDFTLAELNRQCLELAEDALSKVNWSKYGLGR